MQSADKTDFKFNIISCIYNENLTIDFKNCDIICLQKIPTSCVGKLYEYFSNNNYTMIHTLSHENTSISISFPLQYYKLLRCDIKPICEMIELKEIDEKLKETDKKLKETYSNDIISIIFNTLNAFQSYFITKTSLTSLVPSSPRREILSVRPLLSICIELKDSSAPTWVSNVDFSSNIVNEYDIRLQILTAIQYIQKLACETPLIITGNFNINPHGSCYRMITKGEFISSDSCILSLIGLKHWIPMKSVCTNYLNNTFFSNEINYIFFHSIGNSLKCLNGPDYSLYDSTSVCAYFKVALM